MTLKFHRSDTSPWPSDTGVVRTADAVRAEAWEFIVGGGAGFNQLNSYYSTDNPTGAGTENDRILTALKNLRKFMESFDFLRMRPYYIASNPPAGAFVRCMCEPGRQYALYLHHSTLIRCERYHADPGTYRDTFMLIMPPGVYTADPTSITLIGGGTATPATFGTPVMATNSSGSLTKNGLGTLTLTASNSYTGPTVLSAGVTAITTAFFVFIVGMGIRALHKPFISGREGVVGHVGEARTKLAPTGKVFVDGALWTATVESGQIEKGEPVYVESMTGLKLKVRRHSQKVEENNE